MGMMEPGMFSNLNLTSQERQILRTNIQLEIEANQRYIREAQATTNPFLARLWQRFARDEARHASFQRALLDQAGSGTPSSWGGGPGFFGPGPYGGGWPGMPSPSGEEGES